MRKCVLIFFVIPALLGCQNTLQSNFNNGIDTRILQIVDSLPLRPDIYDEQEAQFVSVHFTVDTLLNPIIVIKNCAVIPVPEWESNHGTYREVLITETNWFKGYKTYNNRHLIFTQIQMPDTLIQYFDTFVVSDNLRFDEELCEKYDIYGRNPNLKSKIRDDVTEKVYRIAKNNNLILLNTSNVKTIS